MFGLVFSLIKLAFNWVVLFWIVIGLFVLVFIPGRLYFCENYPLNSFCVDDTYKFIAANQHKEQLALNIEHRDQARKIKVMEANAICRAYDHHCIQDQKTPGDLINPSRLVAC